MAKRCMGCMNIFDSGSVCPSCGYSINSRPEKPGDLNIYTIIADRYIVGRALRRTYYSITYLAWDNRTNLAVNITEYFPLKFVERSANGEKVSCKVDANATLFDECRASVLSNGKKFARISISGGSESILKVTDCFEANGTVYTVTERVRGSSIGDLIASGNKLSYGEAKGIMTSVISDLEFLHKNGILHCNITPDSIYVDDDGKAMLLGFGSVNDVCALSPQERRTYLNDFFIAPEIVSGTEMPDETADVFSLCAVMYFMICGDEGLKYQVSKELLQDNGTNKYASDLIMNGLNENSQGRIPSCARLLEEFDGIGEKIRQDSLRPAPVRTPIYQPPVQPAYVNPNPNPNPVINPVRVPVQNQAQPQKKKSGAVPIIIIALVLLVIVGILIVFLVIKQDSGPGSSDDKTTSATETTEEEETSRKDGAAEPGSSLSASTSKIAVNEEYYFTADSAGTYVIESIDSDGTVSCEVYNGNEYVGSDSDSVDGSNFRLVTYCESGKKITLNTSGEDGKTINVKIYTKSVAEGSNELPYADNIRYDLNLSSGYYIFDADNCWVTVHKSGSVAENGSYFTADIETYDDAYIVISGCDNEEATVKIERITELTVGTNTVSGEYAVLRSSSSGYYRIVSDTSFELGYMSSVIVYEDYDNYSYEYVAQVSDSLLIETDGSGSQVFTVTSVTADDYNGFNSFTDYKTSGIYFDTSDKIYYDYNDTSNSGHFTSEGTQYPVTYYVDDDGNLWLGLKTKNDTYGNIIMWYSLN